jgi:hypothetical protein
MRESPKFNDEWGRFMHMQDEWLQDYLRDACRICPVKVYCCEFYKESTDDRPTKIVYFCNRFELGHCSVYDKLTAVNEVMNASNVDGLLKAQANFESSMAEKMAARGGTGAGSDSSNIAILLNKDDDTSFHLSLQVKRLDALGKEYMTDSQVDPLTTSVAYLKLINVPTMFDLGCIQSDPTSDALTLNMVDEKSFAIEKAEFLTRVRKFKLEKVEKFKSALKAIHTTLSVGETIIFPLGIVTNLAVKQGGLFSNVMKSVTGGGSSKPSQESGTQENGGLPPGSTLDSSNLARIPIRIDGVKYSENAKKIVIKRYRKDNVHVTVPVMTFLPMKVDDLSNS